MGLDMYLKAEVYVSGYAHQDDTEQLRFQLLAAVAGVENFVDPSTPSATLSITVAYWRKANAIHKWFVDNVQDGIDECRAHDVSLNDLRELRDLCQRVIDGTTLVEGQVESHKTLGDDGEWISHYEPGVVAESAELAHKLLPTASGFFFGPTDYDEYYFENLKSTIVQLDRIIDAPGSEDLYFQYQSSW